ncbi:hypothetical protein XENOCAPTIV_002398 [Xenoophorus captivus]|uniref:Uncharacterized protein n=1 Tax=Xenoophorus captivus TaxID=1517983 RepID=A0ABV0QH71_9TELE
MNLSSWQQVIDSLSGSSSLAEELEERRGLISTSTSDWLKEISLMCMTSCMAPTCSCSLTGHKEELPANQSICVSLCLLLLICWTRSCRDMSNVSVFSIPDLFSAFRAFHLL